jgi:hypothetical protein
MVENNNFLLKEAKGYVNFNTKKKKKKKKLNKSELI